MVCWLEAVPGCRVFSVLCVRTWDIQQFERSVHSPAPQCIVLGAYVHICWRVHSKWNWDHCCVRFNSNRSSAVHSCFHCLPFELCILTIGYFVCPFITSSIERILLTVPPRKGNSSLILRFTLPNPLARDKIRSN